MRICIRASMRRSVSIMCCAGGVLGCVAIHMGAVAQTAADAQQVPTLSIAAREVLLDVVVTGKDGQPVTGLTAADFDVSEDGDAQRLTHVEEHRPMNAAAMARLNAEPQLPANTFTNYMPVQNTNALTVVLIDALDQNVQTQMELRQQVIDYVKHMQPGTPIALFLLDTEMRLIQGFSGDPKVLLAAAESKRDMPSMVKPAPGNRDEYRRARIEILRGGFQMMGRYLAGFPGRKNLVWFTGSIPESYRTDPLSSSFGRSFHDDFSLVEEQQGDLMDALTLSRVAVYPVDARGLETLPGFEASNNGRGSTRMNARFEGTRAFEHMDLDTMAAQTGGKAFYNTNGLKQVLARVVANGSSYYTLAYATTNHKWEGQFRHIKVTIARPGVQTQYRAGYYAVDRQKQEQRMLAAMARRKAKADGNPFGDAEQPADEPAANTPEADTGALVKHPKGGFEATMQLGAIPPTEVILTAHVSEGSKVEKLDKNAAPPPNNYLAAEYKGKPFRTYRVKVQADAHALSLTRGADGMRHGTVEFVTLVFDQQGRQVNSMMSTAVLNVTEARYPVLLKAGVPVDLEIAVPVKGNYFLRIGVHDVGSDHIGAIEVPVDAVRTEPGT